MIVYIHGTDPFLAREAILKIKNKYLEKNPAGTELIEIDCDPTSLQLRGTSPTSAGEQTGRNWADLKAVPLFATSRLIIIKRAGELPVAEQDSLASILTDLPASSVVVVWDSKAFKPNGALWVRTHNAPKTIVAEPLTGTALNNWIRGQAAEVGVEVTPEAVNELVDQYGSDLWGIQTDLKTRQGASSISSWGQTQTEKPFILFDYVRGKRWPELKKHLIRSYERGEAVEMTIGALAAAVRKHISNQTLKLKMTETLSEIDIALKSGLIESGDAAALLACYLPDGTSIPLDSSTGVGVNSAHSGSLGASQKRVQWEESWEQLT